MSVGTARALVSAFRQRIGHGLRSGCVQVHDDDRRACLGKRPAELCAEQSHASGDDGHASCQIEFFLNGHMCLYGGAV